MTLLLMLKTVPQNLFRSLLTQLNALVPLLVFTKMLPTPLISISFLVAIHPSVSHARLKLPSPVVQSHAHVAHVALNAHVAVAPVLSCVLIVTVSQPPPVLHIETSSLLFKLSKALMLTFFLLVLILVTLTCSVDFLA